MAILMRSWFRLVNYGKEEFIGKQYAREHGPRWTEAMDRFRLGVP